MLKVGDKVSFLDKDGITRIGEVYSFPPKHPQAVIIMDDDSNLRTLIQSDVYLLKDSNSTLEDDENNNNIRINKVLAKAQSLLIKNVNDKWGVFARSAIDLLPHQLWVCHQILKKWPVRYLVADDVGLGKTIEAGLIIWGLIESRKIQRILILTPAKLTEQWHLRLSSLFDINFNVYTPENSNSSVNFWNTNNKIIVSAPTLQANKSDKQIDRQNALFDSDSWDLVIVDEAHHMNATERGGATLQYQLFEKLQELGKITSTVLFTGTPHRGFDYGFWMLMRLVNPEVFGPNKKSREMYEELGNYFIRNNKANTIDMNGNKLFQEVRQHPETFKYSPEEALFYEKMTEFIQTGKAYSQTLDAKEITRVQLVLIQLQKLASSSIEAVKHALMTRKENLRRVEKRLNIDKKNVKIFLSETDDEENNNIEDALTNYQFKLMVNEEKNLNELISLANNVKEESRIKKIVEIIETQYPDCNILFFTEYIHTQSLLLSALMKKWGEDSVTFINGQGTIDKVLMPNGSYKKFDEDRFEAATLFNEGKKKFLISTEAAGEGIDLQKNCHVLIHVDLPWNPMRLHQRVGRINRYGQKHSVDVISLRNPETIEALLWDKLENKINEIQRSFNAGMGDPEDMMQLVLGMQSDNNWTKLFGNMNLRNNKETIDDWFKVETQTFGGKNTRETVENLVGHANKFQMAGLKNVPNLDLPDLIPFYKRVLKLHHKELIKNEDDSWSFNTPEEWRKGTFGIFPKYKGLFFRRQLKNNESPKKICGVGNVLFDKGLDYAGSITDYSCYISNKNSYFVYRIYDSYENGEENKKLNNDVFVVRYNSLNDEIKILKQDEALKEINNIEYSNTKNYKHLTQIPEKITNLVNEQISNYTEYKLPSIELQVMLAGEI